MGDPEARIERLRLLARLNQRISSSLDYDEALTAIARAASEIMAVPSVSVWVADAETSTVTVRAFSDNRLGSGFDPKPIAFGEHGIGWVALHRKPLHVPDIHAPDSPVGQREWFRARDLHSAYAVPILFQDQILGVLSLTRTTPFDLDDDDTPSRALADLYIALVDPLCDLHRFEDAMIAGYRAMELARRHGDERAQPQRPRL